LILFRAEILPIESSRAAVLLFYLLEEEAKALENLL
jgi:hypothetical protein